MTVQDVVKPEVGRFLAGIEKSVVHYGSSTGFFGRKMFERGPGYLSAAVLYESVVIESYDPQYRLPFPVVAIYPKEGTFWSDHPVGVVDREWVSAEHREAAEAYIRFLLEPAPQARAIPHGFRPGSVDVPLGAPIDAAHGVDPKEPQTKERASQADRISAVVVLSDGEDRDSHTRLGELLDRIRFDGERRTVRVFTIAYGKDAKKDVLQQIAEATQGRAFDGKPENIRQVFRDISMFF